MSRFLEIKAFSFNVAFFPYRSLARNLSVLQKKDQLYCMLYGNIQIFMGNLADSPVE